MITQTINLNLIPGGVLPRIKVSQYDKGSRVLQFNLFNGSSAFTIPVDASITIQGTKADHTGFQYSCTFSGSTVTADLEQQMTVFPGEVECEIRISQDAGDVLLGTCNFILDVEEAALQDDIIISETELPLVEKAAEAADAAEASALDAEAWAVGQRDGEDVPADDPAYHNNSKYYAETVPTLLTNYYTKSETYSKGEVDTALGGKQDTLTFDDSPTSASSNPVKSGGVYNALAGKVDTEAGKGLSKNDFTDAEKAKVDNAVLWSERNGYVGKNLLDNKLVTKIAGNVTFTVNADKSITTSGTSTSDWITVHINEAQFLKAGDYIISGISGGAVGTYRFTVSGDYITDFTLYDGTSSFTVSQDSNITVDLSVRYSGVNMDGKVFYPMIRLASVADSTYEPYLTPNTEIENRIEWSEAKNYVGKNLLNFGAASKTQNAVTFTVNSDKTVTITTEVGGATADAFLDYDFSLPAGDYILSGCTGGSDNTYDILVYNDGWTGSTAVKDGDIAKTFTGTGTRKIRLLVKNGMDLSSNPIVFSPMIRLASVADNTYVPYIPPNDALIEKQKFFSPAKKSVPQYNGDLNDLEAGDVVYVGGSATNAPAGYVLLYTMSVSNLTQSNNYMLQFGIGAASNPLLYVRFKENGTWKPWRKIEGTVIS